MRAKGVIAAAFVSLFLLSGNAQAQSVQGVQGVQGLQGLGGSSFSTTSSFRSPLGALIGAQLLGPAILLKTIKFLLVGAPPASPVCRGFFCRR